MTQTVAHRGDPYHYRENTLPSVRSALLKKADVVEVDVQIAADGVPVLLHDLTLKRLWGHPGAVAGLSSGTISKLTDGRVPTLADALAELRRHESGRLVLDLSEADEAAPCLDAARAAGLADRVYYCGGLGAMREIRRLDADAEIALTWTTSVHPGELLLADVRPQWLNFRFGLIDAPTMSWCRARGLRVAAWTADWERSMARLVGLGVDSITSNRLEALQRVLLAARR